MDRARLLRLIPVAAFTLLPTLLVVSALRPGEYLFGLDVVNASYYLSAVTGGELGSGRLPVWGPQTMCGAPTLAALQAGAFYLPNWLSVVLSPGTLWTFLAMVHLALAGAFCRQWFLRGLRLGAGASMTGALVFMLSGFLVTHLYAGHAAFLFSTAWIPGVLWRLERFLAGPSLKRGALLGLFLTAMILPGSPPVVFIAGVAVEARLLHFILESREGRKARAWTAAGAAVALALGLLAAAPQIFPTLELIRLTQRSEIGSMEFATRDSVPPPNLATLIAPAMLGDEVRASYWGRGFLGEFCGFVGIAVFALAVFGAGGRAPQRRFWLGLSLFGLVLALGSHTPVFPLFYKLFPGASLFRVPARYLLLFTLGQAALAAMGMDRLLRSEESLKRPATVVGCAAAALMIVAACCSVAVTRGAGWMGAFDGGSARPPLLHPDRSATTESKAADAAASLAWAAVSCAFVAAACAVVRLREDGARRLGPLLGGAAVLELLVFGSRFFAGYPVEGMAWPEKFVEAVRRHPSAPFRIAGVSGSVNEPGRCQLSGLEHVAGYDPMILRRYTELINVSLNRKPEAGMVAVPGLRPHPLLNLLGARFWILPGPMKLPETWTSVGVLPDGPVVENPDALPRAFLVDRALLLTDAAERLRFLGSRSFDPKSVLVLEEGTVPEPSGRPAGTVQIVDRAPGRYDLQCDSEADAWLVLAETHYPGWSAEIDGAPAEVRVADHLVQAVRVPAGRHQVRFAYRSRFLGAGLAVTAAIGLSLAAALLLRRRGRPEGK